MQDKAKSLMTLLLPLLLSCFISLGFGKKQTDALSHIYRENGLNSKTGIDRSRFNIASQENHHLDAVKIDSQEGLKEKDRIERLPGQPPVEFRQYGGYVTVNRTAGRALYYYFAEAQQSHHSLPLLLWLNGGPGCSSIGYGAMEELGPFRVHSDGKTLYKNKFAWNYAANVLFLESPAGVGFSYSNTTTDYLINGDRSTAIDGYAFLLNWLERFPEYKNRDFYISGESYAGHYVPQLAHIILHHNHEANKTIIPLKGIIIGNAWINDETDVKGMYEYLGSHALISDKTLDQILKYCGFSANASEVSEECDEAADEADDNTDGIDIYDIYAPVCTDSRLTRKPKKISGMKLDPCSKYYVEAYMNRADVQEALHANLTKLPHPWKSCSEVIGNWTDSPSTVLPLLEELMANGLRVWLYSGDTDGRIPVTSTKNSIRAMGLSVKTSWHPWHLGEQVAGYSEVYEAKLIFATVRGAGHQVPSDKPAAALSLIAHFLSGKHLPNSLTN